MRDISRRIKNAEEKLNLSEKPVTIKIVMFGKGPPPPDRTVGNMTIHHVMYEGMERK